MARAPLKVGVVGTGYFARFHLDAWHRIPGVSLVAVADTDTAKASTAAAEVGNPDVFQSLEDMLGATKLDLIDIATPPVTHAALIARTVAAGVATVCQKPFCTSLSEAREVTGLAERAGVPLIVHENFRFQPWHGEIRRLLTAGAIGDLYQAQFRLRPGDGQGADAYLDRQPYFRTMQRFLVHETAIHHVDLFRFLFGEVRAVYADLRRINPAIVGEDAGLILFTMANGMRAVFDGNRCADHAAANRRLTMGEMIVEGSQGAIRLDGYGRLFLRKRGGNEESELRFEWSDTDFGGDCVYRLQRDAVESLSSGRPPQNEGKDYLRNLVIEEAIYASHEQRRTIDVDGA